MTREILDAYRRHRGRTGLVGHDAESALAYARAEVRLRDAIDEGTYRVIWAPEDSSSCGCVFDYDGPVMLNEGRPDGAICPACEGGSNHG